MNIDSEIENFKANLNKLPASRKKPQSLVLEKDYKQKYSE